MRAKRQGGDYQNLGWLDYIYTPPRLEAQFYKKLMLIDRFFILIELLLNIFNKIKLLGDRNFLRVNQKLSPKKSQPKEKDLHQISSFR